MLKKVAVVIRLADIKASKSPFDRRQISSGERRDQLIHQ